MLSPFIKVIKQRNTFILKFKAWIFYFLFLELILHSHVLPKKKKKLHGKKIESKYGSLCFNYIQIKIRKYRLFPFFQDYLKS